MPKLPSREVQNRQEAAPAIFGGGGRIVLEPRQRRDDGRRAVERHPRSRRRVLTPRLMPGTTCDLRDRVYRVVERLDQESLGLSSSTVSASERGTEEHTAETYKQGDHRAECVLVGERIERSSEKRALW